MPQHLPGKARGFRLERIQNAVAEALELVLLPGLNDPELRGLHVLYVEVSRGLTSIHVLLEAEKPSSTLSDALKRAEPFLRTELAEILLIKKMPSLTLRILS